MPVGHDKREMAKFVKKLHENGKDGLIVNNDRFDVNVYRGTPPEWSNEADPSKRGDTNNV